MGLINGKTLSNAVRPADIAALLAQFTLADELEVFGNTLRTKATLGVDNFRIGTPQTTLTGTSTSSEANVSYDGVTWGNNTATPISLLVGGTISGTGAAGAFGNGTASDYVASSNLATSARGYWAAPGTFGQYDAGAGNTIDVRYVSFAFLAETTISPVIEIETSDDGTTWISRFITPSITERDEHVYFDLGETFTHRFVKATITNIVGSKVLAWASFNVNNADPNNSFSSTFNEVQLDMGEGSYNLAVPSTVILDENNSNIISSGNVLIDYNINGAGYTDTMIDLVDFRQLDNSIFNGASNPKIKFRLIGGQRLKTISIATTASSATLESSGDVVIEVGGVEIGRFSQKADRTELAIAQITSGTIAGINSLDLSNLPTSPAGLPAGSAWNNGGNINVA